MKTSDLLSGAAKSATYNMALQLMLRVLTFVLNAFVLRFISKDLLGVVNVRLMLLYSTAVFITTEAFDRACLTKTEGKNWRQVVNLMWCTTPLCIVCSLILGYLWLYVLEAPDPEIVPYYGFGVLCYALSTVIAVIARPLYVVGQAHLFVKLKVLSLGVAELVKCCTVVILTFTLPHLGLTNFSLAQVLSSLVYVSVYYGYFIVYIQSNKKKADDQFPLSQVRDFFPQTIADKPFIDPEAQTLTWSFFKQSFLKQLLTEGEKYVMTVFGVLSFGDQGLYDVINNLGSMAARFVFLPIEESAYLFFSQTLTRGHSLEEEPKATVDLATKVLYSLLKIVSLLGCIIVVYGYNYSFLALDLYGGQILSVGTGPTLLRWYCLYVLIIAVNGTTECFFFAAMSQKDVDRYNHKLLLFSGIFLLSSWMLTKQFGSVGFILANCSIMLIRIGHSCYFIWRYYHRSEFSPLSGLVPALPVTVTLLLSFLMTRISEIYLCCDHGPVFRLLHIGVGGPTLLRWYCLYVLIIAVNGTTECFFFAAMSQKDVDRYNHKLLLFSGIFLLSSWMLTKQFGSVGFILANCSIMLIRIGHSCYFIWRYYHRSEFSPLSGLVPALPVTVTLLLSFLMTRISEIYLCCDHGPVFRLLHIGVGGVCLLATVGIVYFTEKKVILFIKEQYSSRKTKTE
ncbi:hypothetical protein ScPMuIL_008487 [Solemya velum]